MLQMVFYNGYPKLQAGRRVTVVGTLEAALTGHHHTPVLIQVTSIK